MSIYPYVSRHFVFSLALAGTFFAHAATASAEESSSEIASIKTLTIPASAVIHSNAPTSARQAAAAAAATEERNSPCNFEITAPQEMRVLKDTARHDAAGSSCVWFLDSGKASMSMTFEALAGTTSEYGSVQLYRTDGKLLHELAGAIEPGTTVSALPGTVVLRIDSDEKTSLEGLYAHIQHAD